MRTTGAELRAETQTLAEALRRPQVRGHWGEMQLRRSLELAGLTRHCTFDEQVSTESSTGVQRPDAVVSMAGGKVIVIDSKAPLDAFLSAGTARSADERLGHLRRHAAQVRQHVDALASKAYWRQFARSPEFVVMFLPGEAIFAQALDTDPGLIDDAARKGVMLATPTTLIAMLKTIGYAWTQESVADNAREIHRTATEVYDRLSVASRHLDKVGPLPLHGRVELQLLRRLTRDPGVRQRPATARPRRGNRAAHDAHDPQRGTAPAVGARAGRRGRRPGRDHRSTGSGAVGTASSRRVT